MSSNSGQPSVASPGSEQPQDVQTVTEQGKPVKERIASAAVARRVYEDFKTDDRNDALRRFELQGMIDGRPPYDPNQLEELGLGYMMNCNFLEMRANLDARAASYHELFAEVPTLVDVKLFVPNADPAQLSQWGGIVSEEIDRTIRAWSGFLSTMDLIGREADAYGLGFCLFPNEWDWRPRAFKRGSILLDPRAPLDIADNEVIFVRDEISAGSLFRLTQDDAKVAEEEGWKLKAVRDVLVKVYLEKSQSNSTESYQVSPWEQLQLMWRNNDPTFQSRDFRPVQIVHMLVKEVSTGKVTHLIFPDNMADVNEFLFRAPNRYERMDDVVWWMPFNYGDGRYVRSIRGVASLMAPHDDLSNRFLNRVFDAGFLNASLILQPQTMDDLSKMQLIRMGPTTIVPPGLQAIQTSFTPQIAPLVQLRDLSANIMKNNTGLYRQHAELFTETQAAKTAYQVSQEVAKEARFEKADVAHRYNMLERLYRVMVKRMFNPEYLTSEAELPGKAEAKALVDRCIARGVPAELLQAPGVVEVYATRAIGMGSLGVKLDVTNQIMQARGLGMDEPGRDAAFRDYLAVRVGYRNVERYLPPRNREKTPSNETGIATLENNDFAEGANLPVGSDQNHAIHLSVHLPLVQQLIEGVQQSKGQGLDYKRIIGILSAVLPHMQEHLKAIAADPSRAELVDMGTKLLKMGVATVEFLQKAAQKAEMAQAKQAQAQQDTLNEAQKVLADRELQAKIYEIQQRVALDRMNIENMIATRTAKTDAAIEDKAKRTDAQLQLAAREQEQKLALLGIAEETKREIAGGVATPGTR